MFKINVDLFNPGEFFACCGLVDFSDWVYGGVESRFEGDTFIVSRGSLDEVTNYLKDCEVWSLVNNVESAVVIKNNEKEMLLDWFFDKKRGGVKFKTWAARQKSITILKSLIDLLGGEKIEASDKGSFYLDSNVGKVGSSLGLGFSLNDLNFKKRFVNPFLEVFAFIGLQNFRPYIIGKNDYKYCSWEENLSPFLSRLVVGGELDIYIKRKFKFEVISRGGEYFKCFLGSTELF